MQHVLHFTLDRETKGAVRYREVNADGSDVFDAKVGTLYVRKSALPGRIVQTLTCTIVASDETVATIVKHKNKAA